MIKRLVVLLAFFIAAGCSTPTEAPRKPGAAAPEEEEGDPARDAWVLPDEMGAIYQEQCAVCHGTKLEGAAQGPSLLAVPFTHGDSVAEVTTSIQEGFPSKGMPAWKGIIPPDDIRGVAIYILEQRDLLEDAARQGIGKPPEIPTGTQESEVHDFVLESVYDGLKEPYAITVLPDGRLLVTEKMRGLSLIEADGSKVVAVTGTPRFYDDSVLRGVTYTGTGWAHDVALHPDYENNGWIYLSYGDRCEDCNATARETGLPVSMLKLVRGRLDGDIWTDQETIWEAPLESYQAGAENGAGARIAFDSDGHVFLSLGSFTDYRGIQDLSLPYGKIVRMHDDGRTPADNPFVDVAGALPSIYTLGHRNPQGLDFDVQRGVLWSSEHGPRGGDEGNIIVSGGNYGWPLVSLGVDYDGRPIHYAEEYEIAFDPADLEPPIIDWTPSPGVSSVAFYRGDGFPGWQDQLLVCTLGGNDLLRIVVDETGAQHSETLIRDLGRFRDVAVGPSGDVFLILEHSAGSQVLRVTPAEP